jgi:NADPH2:quinone reductase
MHAIRLHEFGPAENLVFEEVPDPTPATGQVRIKVEAAGVHLIDTALRAGTTGGGPITPPELPTIPGREVAGTVDRLDPVTDRTWLGKRVVVHLGQVPGGYAELAVANADRLHELQPHVDAAAAVATIGTGRTTAGILEQAALTPDDVVLITAAAGGIGSLLVQAARNTGSTVIGLAGGPAKTAQVRDLGAEIAVDYEDITWLDQVQTELAGRPVTAILDGVAGNNARQALDLLTTGGRVITFGWSAGSPLDLTPDQLTARGITTSSPLGPKIAARLRPLETTALHHTTSGYWIPLTTQYPLEQAATAHKALETRNTTGKVVLIP